MSDVERIRIPCEQCKKNNLVPAGILTKNAGSWDVSCANCGEPLPQPMGRATGLRPHVLQATADTLAGYDLVEHVGLVVAAVSTMMFGKISKQEDRLSHAATQALAQLSDQAHEMGANAVVSIKLAANNAEGGPISSNSTGVLASGTAVRVTPSQPSNREG